MNEMFANLAQLDRSFALLGLQLNPSKCGVLILTTPHSASPDAAMAEVRPTMLSIVEIASSSLFLFGRLEKTMRWINL